MKVWIESIEGMNVNHNIWDKTLLFRVFKVNVKKR